MLLRGKLLDLTTMPRRKCEAFDFYFHKKRGGKDVYSCKFCDGEYSRHATRMTNHLKKCVKCPETVRIEFLKGNQIVESKYLSILFIGILIKLNFDKITETNNIRIFFC